MILRCAAIAMLLHTGITPVQGQRSADGDVAALRREVEQLNRGMEAAFNRGDLKGAAAFYSDDAVVRTNREVVAQGRAAIDRYFMGIRNPKSWKLEVIQFGGTRDMVYQVGRSTLVSGEPAHTSIVSYVVLWKRQPDGKLKIYLDYYH